MLRDWNFWCTVMTSAAAVVAIGVSVRQIQLSNKQQLFDRRLKAYMMANENKNKNFLLICYNNKLCEELENEAKYKNQQAENLQVRTFDKFIQENFSNTNDFIKNHSEFMKKVRNRRFFKNLRWNFYR